MYALTVKGKIVDERDDLLDALRASRVRAAKGGKTVEVRDVDDVILAISMPPTSVEGRSRLAAAQRENTGKRARIEPTGTAAICEETRRPHVWWMKQGPPEYLYQCQDCAAQAYTQRGQPLAFKCVLCWRAAVWCDVNERGRRRWKCRVHAPR